MLNEIKIPKNTVVVIDETNIQSSQEALGKIKKEKVDNLKNSINKNLIKATENLAQRVYLENYKTYTNLKI